MPRGTIQKGTRFREIIKYGIEPTCGTILAFQDCMS